MKEDCQGSRDYSAKSAEILHYWILIEPSKYLGLIRSAEKTLVETPTQQDTESPALPTPAGTEGARQGTGWAWKRLFCIRQKIPGTGEFPEGNRRREVKGKEGKRVKPDAFLLAVLCTFKGREET